MIKTASTRDIIEYLTAYEKIHGVGSVISIGSVMTGNRNTEYVFYIRDKNYYEQKIEIPTVDEEKLLNGGDE